MDYARDFRTIDLELAINRAIQKYRRNGYSENRINRRIKSIEVRKALTDEWGRAGVHKGKEYDELTYLMSLIWCLRRVSLCDKMTNRYRTGIEHIAQGSRNGCICWPQSAEF